MVEIPVVFDQPGAGFVLLPEGIKFPPIEKGWQKKPHTFTEATAHKGNVGVMAGNGYIGLDQDQPDAFNEITIPLTTTWETRPGRLGLWFKCSDVTPEVLARYGKKGDTAQLKLYKDGKPCGEIKLQRAYQVIPPSHKFIDPATGGDAHPGKGNRVDYKLLYSSPPTEISLANLLAALQDTGITFGSKLEVNAAKLEGMATKARQRRVKSDEDRAAAYAAAALQSEILVLASTPHGDRNNQLYKSAAAMGEFVGAKVLTEAEVVTALSKAAEYTGLTLEEIEKTIQSGLEAGKKHPREIPAQEPPTTTPEAARPTAAEIIERITADPRALKDDAILASLAELKANDPIEFDLILKSIKEAGTGIKVATINEVVDKCILENKKANEKPQDMPKDITDAAQEIIDGGRAYEHIYKVWQKRVKGNEYLGKSLLVSRGVQSCLNTKGVHVYSHGKHGHGKSEGMEKMIELVPPEYRMDEDVSPLAIYYASKNGMLLPGTTLLIDEMVWNDSLAGIIKRVITRFQKGAGHLTVIDGLPILVRTQPRLAIWTNSADLQADEQVRDRFHDEPITEGENYVSEIIEFQKQRDILQDSSEDVDRETAICQAILRDLAGKTFTVKIPFAKRINIQASEGTRGYNIFSDLVKGLTAMRYAQRKTNDQGQLLAIVADFKDAKDIYEGSKGHSEESYTTAETKVLQAIIDHGYKALYKDIKTLTTMSEGRIKDIVNGRGKDEQKRHGLRYKCPQLEVNTVDISVVIAGTYSDRVTTHPVELSLPTSFRLTDGIRENLVTLDPDVERRSSDVDPDVDDIDNSRDSDVVDVVKEEREREKDTSKSSSPLVGGNIPSLPQKPRNPTSTTSGSLPIAKSSTSTPATPYVNYVCAECGADLTDHSQMTINGKLYCAKPGCGYPKRGEEEGRANA
jgi:hypothetical protein